MLAAGSTPDPDSDPDPDWSCCNVWPKSVPRLLVYSCRSAPARLLNLVEHTMRRLEGSTQPVAISGVSSTAATRGAAVRFGAIRVAVGDCEGVASEGKATAFGFVLVLGLGPGPGLV